MKDLVVIIILNYNQNDYTIDCVNSLLESKYDNFRILLIDNGSVPSNVEDFEQRLPSDSKLHLHKIKNNVGYVRGTNSGFKIASEWSPDYFMVMNNDTIIDNNSIGVFVETCKEFDNKAIVTGKVYHYDEPSKLQFIGYELKNEKSLTYSQLGKDVEDKGQFDEIVERDMIDDIFGLFPFSLYQSIGGYSDYFWFSAEQADFALRAKSQGYKLIYTPHAKLWHKGSVTIGGRDRNPKMAYWHTQGTLIFRFRHLSTWRFVKEYFRIAFSVLSSFLSTLMSNIKGGDKSYDYPKAKLAGLSYFNKWIFTREINSGESPFDK